MADTLIPVNIVIADRSYRLKIEPEDEEIVRKTIRIINDKVVEFKAHFSGKDMQDYVAMVLLWYATEQQKPLVDGSLSEDDLSEIKRMDDLLDKTLNG